MWLKLCNVRKKERKILIRNVLRVNNYLTLIYVLVNDYSYYKRTTVGYIV